MAKGCVHSPVFSESSLAACNAMPGAHMCTTQSIVRLPKVTHGGIIACTGEMVRKSIAILLVPVMETSLSITWRVNHPIVAVYTIEGYCEIESPEPCVLTRINLQNNVEWNRITKQKHHTTIPEVWKYAQGFFILLETHSCSVNTQMHQKDKHPGPKSSCEGCGPRMWTAAHRSMGWGVFSILSGVGPMLVSLVIL